MREPPIEEIMQKIVEAFQPRPRSLQPAEVFGDEGAVVG